MHNKEHKNTKKIMMNWILLCTVLQKHWSLVHFTRLLHSRRNLKITELHLNISEFVLIISGQKVSSMPMLLTISTLKKSYKIWMLQRKISIEILIAELNWIFSLRQQMMSKIASSKDLVIKNGNLEHFIYII